MPVTLVSENVLIPKEAKDVKDLIVGLVRAIKDKKGMAELMATELPALIAAVDGISELGDEAKAPQIAVLAGLLGGQVGEVLLS